MALKAGVLSPLSKYSWYKKKKKPTTSSTIIPKKIIPKKIVPPKPVKKISEKDYHLKFQTMTRPKKVPGQKELKKLEERLKQQQEVEAAEIIQAGGVKSPPSLKQKEARRRGIIEELGSEELSEELQRKIDVPIPLPGEQVATEPGAPPSLLSEENLKATAESMIAAFLPGLLPAAKYLGGVALAKLGISAGTTSIGAKAGSTLVAASVGFLASVGLGKVTDFRRKELDVMEKTLAGIQAHSSSVLSSASNGSTDPFDAMETLRNLSADIDFAESNIKQVAITNVAFRTSKEYFEIQQLLATTRQNVLERVGGVESIALTGRPTPTPEDLMVTMSELNEHRLGKENE